MRTKICTKCGRELPLSEFSKDKTRKDGLQPYCKECSKQYNKQYRADNAEHIKQRNKQYRADNAEHIKQYSKQWRTDNPEHIKQYSKQYRADNAEHIKQYNKQYRADNAEHIKQYRADNAEHIKQYNKQYRADNAEHIKQYRADNAEHIKQYNKQYKAEKYATIEGYAYFVRYNNLQKDRKYGRIAADEDPLPSLEYYIWALQQPDFYDKKQYHWSEMGLDRIYNDKPHTFANVVPCTTEHNRQRGMKSFEEFCELMRKEKC